jgi:hypothetical protein
MMTVEDRTVLLSNIRRGFHLDDLLEFPEAATPRGENHLPCDQ